MALPTVKDYVSMYNWVIHSEPEDYKQFSTPYSVECLSRYRWGRVNAPTAREREELRLALIQGAFDYDIGLGMKVHVALEKYREANEAHD